MSFCEHGGPTGHCRVCRGMPPCPHGSPNHDNGPWCGDCFMEREAEQQRINQAMHDLLVWTVCEGFQNPLRAVWAQGWDDGVSAAMGAFENVQ